MVVDGVTYEPEVQLDGLLAEFRTALKSEIEAARRSESSSAVGLLNGRRVAQIGASFQYLFEAETILNLPSDTPGDLYIPDSAPLRVEVVSIDGMAITLRVSDDLGAFVPYARLQSNMAYLMEKLIERIEHLSGRSNPVGDRVLGKAPITGCPERVAVMGPTDDKMNAEQRSAIAASLGFSTTFLLGPPGTGKTATIGMIGQELHQRRRSVLLVSHTNTAVDQAMLRIGEKMSEGDRKAGRVIRVGDPSDQCLIEQTDLLAKTHVERRSAELVARRDALTTEQDVAGSRLSEVVRCIELWEWVQDAADDIGEMECALDALAAMESTLADRRQQHAQMIQASGYWTEAMAAAKHAKHVQTQIARLRPLLASARERTAMSAVERDAAQQQLDEAEALLAEVNAMGWLKRKWNRLPTPEEQETVVVLCRNAVTDCQAAVDVHQRTCEEIERGIAQFTGVIEAFDREYAGDPDDVILQAEAHSREVDLLLAEVQQLVQECRNRRSYLGSVSRDRICVLRDWGLAVADDESLAGMIASTRAAHAEAANCVSQYDIRAMRRERDEVNDRIRVLDDELRDIEEQLERVEEIVIAEAAIVATTLTRAYLRDSIQARSFHTVILDEASMAPIPSLWVAASLATDNAVVTGDPNQLPPIVLSEHQLAKQWLGQDIFRVAEAGDETPDKPHVVMLKEQHRMHPEISAIPNELIYGRKLRDAERVGNEDYNNTLSEWYQFGWGNDHPVLLVDTSSLNAWVTSVARGSHSSRLNFLSATVCADLAELLLRSDRPKCTEGKHRILIAAPYRPHAQLVQLLLKEQGIDRDVVAGTAHTFQGAEADVVIFDLVNDEPHWRVALFMAQHDESSKRLLNVALTRAKRRLVVVGDFSYNSRQGHNAFLGLKLIPVLQRYPMVDAKEIIPRGFANRAAQAQARVAGGAVEADASRTVVTQERFYPFLTQDMMGATGRIVIFSPFITQDRLSTLAPQLQAAIERGVHLYVVTKAIDERNRSDRPLYQFLEDALRQWGATVIHKRGMHEKLVFVDNNILWAGSLNPLSFRNTQEHMERRLSQAVVQDYTRALHLDDLLDEYENGQPSCPICGSELIASEGKNDPFYWRCVVDGCYRRSIGQPRINGSTIVCSSCGGSVEYGTWGGKPSWRCVANRRHHQEVAATHLRLPAMRDLIPEMELRKLDKAFGLRTTTGELRSEQPSLFS